MREKKSIHTRTQNLLRLDEISQNKYVHILCTMETSVRWFCCYGLTLTNEHFTYERLKNRKGADVSIKFLIKCISQSDGQAHAAGEEK